MSYTIPEEVEPIVALVQQHLKDTGKYLGHVDRKPGILTWKAIANALAIPEPQRPGGNVDRRSWKNLNTIPDPQIRARFSAFISDARTELERRMGLEAKVISGYRSFEEQKKLYDKYRAGTGHKAAPPGYSWHNYGRAVDLGIFDDKGCYLDSTDPRKAHAAYKMVIAPVAKRHGLRWGGSFGDDPHFAYADTNGPTEQDREDWKKSHVVA